MDTINNITRGAAIITGGSRGLGLGIARSLSGAGYPVVIAAREQHDLDVAASSINGPVVTLATDVSNDDDVDRMIEQARERFGTIDAVVNNAGAPPVIETLDTLTWRRWSTSIDVDVHGTFATTRAVAPLMRAQGGGTIINIVGAGGGGMSSPAHLSFSPSQAALTSLSRCIATILKPAGVVVHTVFPSLTPHGGIGRVAAPALGVSFDDDVLTPAGMGDAIVELMSKRESADWYVSPKGLASASA